MSGRTSDDDIMDDGLHIKPPQPHVRHRPHHKERKREKESKTHGHGHDQHGSVSGGSTSSSRHSQKSRDRKDHHSLGVMSAVGVGGDGRQQRRHHRAGGEEEDSRASRGRQRERGNRLIPPPGHEMEIMERIERRERERGSSSSKHRSSGGGGGSSSGRRKRGDEDKSGILLEVQKERRNIELENERALREIERRREKEKEGEVSSASGGGGRHRREKRSHRDRDRGDRERERGGGTGERSKRPPPTASPPPEEEEMERVEEKQEIFIDERIHLEVQDIEDSASDLEEGERSRSDHSKEEQEQGHGEASDVSSVSDNETEEIRQDKPQTDGSSSSSSSRKSRSDGKSEATSSSSSSSDSDSEHGEEKRNGEDGLKPPKVPRKDSPTSPMEGNNEKSQTGPSSEDSREIPVVVITPEEDEEDVLPPYYPALQGCRRVEEFQLLNRIEEGTYGVVYRAKEKRTDEVVALKRLKMEKEKDGFPITSLREINTLLKAQHENIVTVREIVVGSNTDKIFLVMDYVEHDLKALMETLKQKGQVFLPEEVKCLIIQLLRAVAHLHDNWILHRDLKTSNLLLSHKGILKVGDFGLAREYGSPLKAYTPIVVTLWYRAPELLLGTKEYSTPIDIWSVGCIFGELLKMEPMFPGKSEPNQLNLIFQSLGTPNDRIWPGYSQLPVLQKMTFADYPVNKLKTRFGHLTDQGIDLMNKFLTFNPAKRITAEDALDHAFFKEMPVAIDPSMFPTWPAKSELGHRKAVISPKPPSRGHQFKGKDDEDPAGVGFFLGGGDARRQPTGAGFSLKF